MDNLMDVLTIVLVMLIFFILILAFIYWYMSYKNKLAKEKEEKKVTPGATTKIATEYTKKSIFKFMQFDKIEDNMIIQDNGNKYLMVIECEGVNYDLMSEVEKTAVEAGFVQFLNTLRYPIQIYTQTRSVNISDSIKNYRNKLERTKKELDLKQQEYSKITAQENYNVEKAENLRRDIIRIKNLYEYGQDVIDDIYKTSQNRNVLRKHYYIVVPYHKAEIGSDLLTPEETNSMIFSELYTRAQSLIRALLACEMRCKILDSNELVELLYIAYNRDDAEIYGIKEAINAGYTELYSKAPDVLEKRIKALDKEIEDKALKMATEKIGEARSEKQKKIAEKENHIESLIKQLAEDLIKENEKYVGEDVAKSAIAKIENTEEGGNEDEQKTKRRTRRISNAE